MATKKRPAKKTTKRTRYKVIKAKCSDCSGTGVYCGMCEPEGVGVVCLRCGGSGCELIMYTPFKGRVAKKGVKTVRLSRGALLADAAGPGGSEVSYKDFFLKGKMPKP
jgi:hypothetical protein